MRNLLLATCILILIACNHELTDNPITKDTPNITFTLSSFWDSEFNPYPTSNATSYLSDQSEGFIDDFVDGLSAASDSIAANYDDFNPNSLQYFNAYRASLSLSPITSLPIAYDFGNDQGLSTAVEQAVLDFFDEANLDTREFNSSTYQDIADAVDEFSYSGLTVQQSDTVATILYATQILANWATFEPLWYEESEENINGNPPITTRGRICLCIFCKCYITTPTLNDLKCAAGVIGGTLAGGSVGGPWGAVAGGLIAWDASSHCP